MRPLPPKRLTDQAFDAIAIHCPRQMPFRHCQTQASLRLLARGDDNNQAGTRKAPAATKNHAEFRRVMQARGGWELRLSHCCRLSVLNLRGQPFAPLVSA